MKFQDDNLDNLDAPNIHTYIHTYIHTFIPSSTFLVNGDAYILPYRLHTYLGLNISGSPY